MLGATLEAVEDPKKQYAFRLACKGVPEMWFAAETKEKLDEWISCLTKTALMSKLWHKLCSITMHGYFIMYNLCATVGCLMKSLCLDCTFS